MRGGVGRVTVWLMVLGIVTADFNLYLEKQERQRLIRKSKERIGKIAAVGVQNNALRGCLRHIRIMSLDGTDLVSPYSRIQSC